MASSYKVINPATGKPSGAAYPGMPPAEVERVVAATHSVQQAWRKTPFSERAEALRNAAKILKDDAQEFAELMTEEMGKPIKQGLSEVEKCAWVCTYYAEHGAKLLASTKVKTDASQSYVVYQPLGVVLAIMPWNFPFWQVFRFAAPALMAGNGGLLKHAQNVPGCALAIEEILYAAGFPKHLFRALLIDKKQVAGLIKDPRIQAVTLTGSTAAGRAVAQQAGAALKPTVLELGGSDPYVILEDADLKQAVDTCVTSRMINGGQSCIAAKRFIVPEVLRADFEKQVVKKMKTYKMGDPMDKKTKLGPMARKDLRDDLHRQVLDCVTKGATLLTGGQIPDQPGAYYPATVLTDVKPGMPAYDDELFGPVAAILPVKDEAEAIRVANDTVFGLGAAVFTRDVKRGKRIAETELHAGSCFVNAFVRSDPRLPFGGIKESGYGRELAEAGIKSFVNTKTVYVG